MTDARVVARSRCAGRADRVVLLALSLLACAGCAAVQRDVGSATFDRAEVVETFLRWREGERRREAELAQSALHFETSPDRAFHHAELDALRGVYAGPIRTAQEIHLVGHPEPLGPGDYLFLEPAGEIYATTFVTLVAVGGAPRIVYRRPALSEVQRRDLSPEEEVHLLLAERITFWRSLVGPALAAEVDRTRRQLGYEVEARAYAERHELPLVRAEPSPRELLTHLAPLDAEAARAEILRMLRGATSSR